MHVSSCAYMHLSLPVCLCVSLSLSVRASVGVLCAFVCRCRELDQELVSLRTQLGERQQVQAENERLRLQLESLQAHNKMEQKKAQEEK